MICFLISKTQKGANICNNNNQYDNVLSYYQNNS